MTTTAAHQVSPTLAINTEISRRRAAGLRTIALGFGEASIPIHPSLTAKLSEYAQLGGYGPVDGVPALREAAAGYLSRRGIPTEPGQLVAGPGTKPLLYALTRALGGPLALPKPSWVSYAAQAALHGVAAPMISTAAGGLPDPRLLDQHAERVGADGTPLAGVLITTPDNPTGTLAGPESIKDLCMVAERQDLMIIADEIYRDLVHDASTAFCSAAEILPDRTIVTTGLSKNLALGGWRIGIVRFPATDHGARLRDTVVSMASEIWSAPAQPVQYAAAWAFTEPPDLIDRVAASARLHGRIALAVADRFTAAGAAVAAPTAGFYLYPDFDPLADRLRTAGIVDSPTLATRLLGDHGIATLPGAAFGDDPGRLTLRIATPMLYGEDDRQRMQALENQQPENLPWIAGALDELSSALAGLLDSRP